MNWATPDCGKHLCQTHVDKHGLMKLEFLGRILQFRFLKANYFTRFLQRYGEGAFYA